MWADACSVPGLAEGLAEGQATVLDISCFIPTWFVILPATWTWPAVVTTRHVTAMIEARLAEYSVTCHGCSVT